MRSHGVLQTEGKGTTGRACVPSRKSFLKVFLGGYFTALTNNPGCFNNTVWKFLFIPFFNLKLEPAPAPFSLVFGGNQHISTQEMLTEHYVLQTGTPGNIVKERFIVFVDYLH